MHVLVACAYQRQMLIQILIQIQLLIQILFLMVLDQNTDACSYRAEQLELMNTAHTIWMLARAL